MVERSEREHPMKTLFLDGFTVAAAPRILARVTTKLNTDILADERDHQRLISLLAEAEIIVGHIWRTDYPPAPRLRVLQSVAAGLDLIDRAAIPKAVTVCSVYGHEPAIAEYVITTMLVLTRRLFELVSEFRCGSWAARQTSGGKPRGEVMGRTLGIVGYGRIGREVASRAAGLKCRVVAANRSPVASAGPADRNYPLAELDPMLPECEMLLIACVLGPETHGLIDARRLALMKPGAILINIARAPIVDEAALYSALWEGHLGGAAIDVWSREPTADEPRRRPSEHPFHELPNVLMTPHCSGFTDGAVERSWGSVAGNLDRLVRGEALENVVAKT
jgi:phosphoglycerate dehydrogenase-like enzyme